MTRGEIFRLASSRSARGRQQSGSRYGVIVQSDELTLSTVLVAPTSTAALPTSFRPAITVDGTLTRVMVEQTCAMDIERLGRSAGRLDVHELRDLDEALSLALGL